MRWVISRSSRLDKGADVIGIFATEQEAESAHAELLDGIEAAHAGKRSIVRFGNGRYAVDAKRYVSSRGSTVENTAGLNGPVGYFVPVDD